MDEGKPTKAKWWSRPRPQEPTGDRHTTNGDEATATEEAAEAAADGTPVTPPPTPDGTPVTPPPTSDGTPVTPPPTLDGTPVTPPPTPDGDFELARPAAPQDRSTAAAPGEAGARHAPGSANPGSGEVVAAEAVPGPDAFADAPRGASGRADFVNGAFGGAGSSGAAADLDAARVGGGVAGAASGQACAAEAVDASCGAPASAGPGDGVFGGAGSAGAAAGLDAARVGGGVAGAEAVAAGRPTPLHDPDPYSTPPYGEPGPWAPAPPVQHPAVAAAHGTATAPGSTAPPPVASAAGSGPAGPPSADPASAAADGPVSDAGQGAMAAALGDCGYPPASPAGSSGPEPSAEGGPADFDPWQRYDPWAAASPRGADAPAGPWQHSEAGALAAGERRRWVRSQLVGGAVAVALVSGVLGGAVGVYLERNGGLDPVRLPQASAEPAGRPADGVAGIAARALPSVVTLHVSGGEEGGTGTGFVLDSLGYILTNNHVVEPAGSDGAITVVFNGGQTAKAEVVGRDSGYDLAVVRVTGVKGLRPLYLGNSDNVRVGDPVVAIGAPFDLEGTVTSGIISAKERPITSGGDGTGIDDVSYVDALQTDAPINPGNSGGPLLDAQGHVIGINSAIRSADDGVGTGNAKSGSIGLGFAIPINQGKRVAEELINTGKATHPVIGISLDLQYAGDGARISAKARDGGSPVTVGGPGAKAGLRAGDVVTEVDGQRVHSGEELIVRTRAHRPGDRLRLTILRDGAEQAVTLVLGSSGGS
jgi:putative serine protease PepD